MKIKILTIGAILTLIALTVIQGYLIHNTYQLKKKAIVFDARSAIAKIYNSKKIDSLMWLYRNDFLLQLDNYNEKKISKNDVVENLKSKTKQINSLFLEEYNYRLNENDEPYDIKFKKTVNSITLRDNLNNVETFLNENDSPVFLIGENFDNEEAILINNSTWSKEHDFFVNNNKTSSFL